MPTFVAAGDECGKTLSRNGVTSTSVIAKAKCTALYSQHARQHPIKTLPLSISVAETNSSNTPALNIQAKTPAPSPPHKSFVIKTANVRERAILRSSPRE